MPLLALAVFSLTACCTSASPAFAPSTSRDAAAKTTAIAISQPQDPAVQATPPWRRNAIADVTHEQFVAMIPQLRWLRLHYATDAGPSTEVMVALEDQAKVQELAALLPASMLAAPTAAAAGQPEGLWLAWELADGRHVPAFVQRRIDSKPPHAMTLLPKMPAALEDAVMRLHTQAAKQLRLQLGRVVRLAELADVPPSLTTLQCPTPSRAQLPQLARLSQLTHLVVLGGEAPDRTAGSTLLPEVPERFVASLAALPRLQHLQLPAVLCDDTTADSLSQLPSLVSLRLDHEAKGLEGGLGLSGHHRLTIQGVRALAPKLHELELRGETLPAAGFEALLAADQLRRFASFDAPMPAELVARLAHLANLRELGLGPCRAEHLAALAGSRLERLELAQVTARTADFAGLPRSLRELDLRRSGLQPSEHQAEIAKLLPQCVVQWPATADATAPSPATKPAADAAPRAR